jgi:hypothetical protein
LAAFISGKRLINQEKSKTSIRNYIFPSLRLLLTAVHFPVKESNRLFFQPSLFLQGYFCAAKTSVGLLQPADSEEEILTLEHTILCLLAVSGYKAE